MTWITSGTIALANGSDAVTGTGTGWSIEQIRPGDALYTAAGALVGEIETVNSPTSITLVQPVNTAGSGLGYRIVPTRARDVQLGDRLGTLITNYAGVADTVGLGMFGDGSVAAPGMRFTMDQDTGFYRVGANSTGYASGGVLRVRFDSAGLSVIGGELGYANSDTVPYCRTGLGEDYRQYSTLNAYEDEATFKYVSLGGFTGFASRTWQDGSGFGYDTCSTGTNPIVWTNRFQIDATGNVLAGGDGVQSIGSASRRYSVVYASTGSINTSDEREKQQADQMPDAWLDAWGDIGWSRFKFNDAVTAKGEGARWHLGLIAQEVRDAFDARGLDATAIGLLCFDQWETGDRWGLRYEECFAIEAAWQRRRLTDLEARLSLLEAA